MSESGLAPSSACVDGEYSRAEEWINQVTHGLAAVFSIVGMVALVALAAPSQDIWKITGLSIYGASLTLLFMASTFYHSARRPGVRRLFKMLDHCAIFVLIAGTYTPFLLVNMRGPTGWILFGVVWGLALAGITLKLVFGHRFQIVQMVIYLSMGWLIVFAFGDLLDSVNTLGVGLVVAGGITYTLGIVFYLVERIPFNHAIWHVFVMGGSACHFFAIYHGVLNGHLS